MISKELDAEFRAYAYLKITESHQVCKIRIPLWAAFSIVDRCIEFPTYHGAEAPVGKMSIPLAVISHFESRWIYAENDDDE